jgi:hypothetical protein
MASLADIRIAIADRLTDIDGLRVHAHPVAIFTRPVAWVGWPDSFETATTFDRTVTIRIPVTIEVDAPHDRGGDVALGAYIESDGRASIEQLFDDDPTLDGVVHSAAVVEWRALGPASTEDSMIYTATAVVEVLA